jgi:hypothetical protein
LTFQAQCECPPRPTKMGRLADRRSKNCACRKVKVL